MTEVESPVAEDANLESADLNHDSYPVWSSDSELGLEQARHLSSERGATVAMFLGEVGVGKTTILVELWTDLLQYGSLGDALFGGSCTTIPFEERSFQSRIRAGSCASYTLKTNEDDDGFLHLRIRRGDGRMVELLLSDFAGEHFTRIREGTELADELEWASRVDRFVVVIDGKAFNPSAGSMENALNRTSRLLAALERLQQTLPLVGRPRPRLLLLLAKDDSIAPETRTGIEQALDQLLVIGRRVDAGCELLRVAARPTNGVSAYGLVELGEWLTDVDGAVTATVLPSVVSSRAFGRFQNG